MTDAELEELARDVLATLDGASAPTLYAFATGLQLTTGPTALFAGPILYLASDVEHEQPVGWLTLLAMRYALKQAALERSLIAKLADADEAFWAAVGDAVAAIAEEMSTP